MKPSPKTRTWCALSSSADARGGGRGGGAPGRHLGTAVEAVHAVLLAEVLLLQVPAGVLLLRVLHVAVELVVAAATVVYLVDSRSATDGHAIGWKDIWH